LIQIGFAHHFADRVADRLGDLRSAIEPNVFRENLFYCVSLRIRPEGCQKLIWMWMIRSVFGMMAETNAPVDIDDENAGQLMHITFGNPQTMAFKQRR
jgi:hypothetical protein